MANSRCRACPYSLSPVRCGHTFCALCLLKWWLSNLCDDCGGWCNTLQCPLCRQLLPSIYNTVPRAMYKLPFTPARLADERIVELLDVLQGPELENPDAAAPTGLSTGWERGGELRAEWQSRDKRGRDEMRYIADRWVDLPPILLKVMKSDVCAA
ncbi:uncharacterized protein B0H18DRAFT_871805 [Fomitopsis serialis]|uniref:uncharacterized protein n=1 Tax=Fomitopsis serialis TaxID=139415 RepID=UPI0020083A06|nr:uncharacterized protein B0H18DRAFT_871805 [Neoantrodia serialis]KAH9931843.1 hypothetical protein B0H18DRAFT_871805 [Neoantrodia serialis]